MATEIVELRDISGSSDVVVVLDDFLLKCWARFSAAERKIWIR